ncbi:aminopeptidase [Alicyclobacillus contaminans]|uniref:aminopeptidase n=1 Tax=Alicyclobacillus contaminans TaxID=392016 RepID=UPI0004050497|nr:aminopeptidase [Alicyclobacillus contaminans]GMA51478.1 aminopeptidase [Alicyclobacillus contaminans]
MHDATLQEKLKQYAQLAIRVGLNLQPGQHLVIGYGQRQVLPEHVEFVRMVVDAAYDAGAKFVQVDWGDEWWLRETIARGDLDTLAARARWQAQWVEQLAKEGAAYLALPATNPDLFVGVDAERVTRGTRSIQSALREFNKRRTNDEYAWTLMGAPTQAWADKVYPELPAEERIPALWRDILACARVIGDDPIAGWQQHIRNLHKRSEWLNGLNIRSLHYQGPGTDLTVELPDGYFWTAASKDTPQGVTFVANIPTEEVFTAPKKTGVNGVVTSTLPLNHNGTLIEGLTLRFEHGRIVEYGAKSGEAALKNIVEADEGSHYLGEIALVPVESPIAKMNRLFYNTLYDENASCHLAIGEAYPLVEGGQTLKREEWEAHGLNESIMHVDFMIGSPELNIDATTADGTQVPIFRQGNWATRLD